MSKTLLELFNSGDYGISTSPDTTPISDENNNYQIDDKGTFATYPFFSDSNPRNIPIPNNYPSISLGSSDNYQLNPDGSFLNLNFWKYFAPTTSGLYSSPIDLLNANKEKGGEFQFFNNISVFGKPITDNAVFSIPTNKIDPIFSPYLNRISADTDGGSIRMTSLVEVNNPLLYGSDTIRIGTQTTSTVSLMKEASLGGNSKISLNLNSFISKLANELSSVVGIPTPAVPTYVTNYTKRGSSEYLIATSVREIPNNLQKIKQKADGFFIGRLLSSAQGSPDDMIGNLANSAATKTKKAIRGLFFGDSDVGSNSTSKFCIYHQFDKRGLSYTDLVDKNKIFGTDIDDIEARGFDVDTEYPKVVKKTITESNGSTLFPAGVRGASFKAASPIFGISRAGINSDNRYGTSEYSYIDRSASNCDTKNLTHPQAPYRSRSPEKLGRLFNQPLGEACRLLKNGEHWDTCINTPTPTDIDNRSSKFLYNSPLFSRSCLRAPLNCFNPYYSLLEDGSNPSDGGYTAQCKALIREFKSDYDTYRNELLTNRTEFLSSGSAVYYGGLSDIVFDDNGRPDDPPDHVKVNVDKLDAISKSHSIIPFWIKELKTDSNGVSVDSFSTVFKVLVSSLEETFSPDWGSSNFVGNPYKYYTYSGVERSLSLSLQLYSESPYDFLNNWRQLKFLSRLTYPIFEDSKLTSPPIMQFRLGDLYNNREAIIDSLSFNYSDNLLWETEDGLMLPKFINVSIGLKLVEDIGSEKYPYDLPNETTNNLVHNHIRDREAKLSVFVGERAEKLIRNKGPFP